MFATFTHAINSTMPTRGEKEIETGRAVALESIAQGISP